MNIKKSPIRAIFLFCITLYDTEKMTWCYFDFPYYIPNTPRLFRGYNDASLHRFVMGDQIPANPYPYEFDMNYIITLLKKQRGICSHKYMHV